MARSRGGAVAGGPRRRADRGGKSGEDALVAWLRRTLGSPARELIGDDAAMLRLGGEWALTVDSQIEGTHFIAGLDPAVVARRLLAVNVSDLAAVTDEQRAEMSKSVAEIFERVLTQDCRTQYREAKKNEGENMLAMSLGTLVQVAMGNLIDNPAVSQALGGIDKDLNKQKFAEAAAEP